MNFVRTEFEMKLSQSRTNTHSQRVNIAEVETSVQMFDRSVLPLLCTLCKGWWVDVNYVEGRWVESVLVAPSTLVNSQSLWLWLQKNTNL